MTGKKRLTLSYPWPNPGPPGGAPAYKVEKVVNSAAYVPGDLLYALTVGGLRNFEVTVIARKGDE